MVCQSHLSRPFLRRFNFLFPRQISLYLATFDVVSGFICKKNEKEEEERPVCKANNDQRGNFPNSVLFLKHFRFLVVFISYTDRLASFPEYPPLLGLFQESSK